MRCIIVSGGSIEDLNWLKNYIKKDDFVICADSGAEYLSELDLVPSVIVGDFDSLAKKTLEKYVNKDVVVKTYSKDKDDTDTALALSEALKMKFKEIIIIGALGSRFDHSLANVHLLKRALEKGTEAKIVDKYNEISLIPEGEIVTMKGSKGDTFSLLPLTEKVTGINVKGAKWPLKNAAFNIGNPYGISNLIAESTVEISIREGIMLLIKVTEGGE
jgi:thiamine pyrophosphokinase